MSSMILGRFLLLAALQGPIPRLQLGKPEGVSAEGFSSVNGVAEFRNGLLVAVDGRDRLVRLVDFTRGTVRPIGRSGNGPGEYQAPGGAMTTTGDTVWTTAVGNRRVLGITPDGSIASSLTVPIAEMFRGRESYSFSAFHARAPSGHFYWESYNYDPAKRMGEVPLTAGIYRWRPGTETAELVRTVIFRDKDFPVAFNRRDGWAVGPDGSVAVVYGADYHVEWLNPDGSVVKGPPTDYPRIPVTQDEKEAWTRARASVPAGRAIAQSPAGGGSGPQPAPRPPADVRFPDAMPPFPDRNSVWISNEGDLWVVTSRPVDAKNGLVDVFDRTGRRVRQVELPPGTRVAGFGVRAVYLTREDEDGLLWIERYRL